MRVARGGPTSTAPIERQSSVVSSPPWLVSHVYVKLHTCVAWSLKRSARTIGPQTDGSCERKACCDHHRKDNT